MEEVHLPASARVAFKKRSLTPAVQPTFFWLINSIMLCKYQLVLGNSRCTLKCAPVARRTEDEAGTCTRLGKKHIVKEGCSIYLIVHRSRQIHIRQNGGGCREGQNSCKTSHDGHTK